jgi:hypothetical protein
MTRQPHDQFAKQYLKGLLSGLGNVESSRDVGAEVQQIDVWFDPTPQETMTPELLGLLGKMVSVSCLLEAFRNQPSKAEIRTCLQKLFAVEGELKRSSRREQDSTGETQFPRLWILATSASTNLLDTFGAKLDLDNWPDGVYFMADGLRSANGSCRRRACGYRRD